MKQIDYIMSDYKFEILDPIGYPCACSMTITNQDAKHTKNWCFSETRGIGISRGYKTKIGVSKITKVVK